MKDPVHARLTGHSRAVGWAKRRRQREREGSGRAARRSSSSANLFSSYDVTAACDELPSIAPQRGRYARVVCGSVSHSRLLSSAAGGWRSGVSRPSRSFSQRRRWLSSSDERRPSTPVTVTATRADNAVDVTRPARTGQTVRVQTKCQ
uniref:Uncharacterized protein n=1 Tax=Plectus sambesii TaxID=2011161 RepID=A0A914VA56_9BILA